MMIQEINISINGFEKKEAKYLINSILEIFTLFTYLDLRRFSALIVTENFDDEIKTLCINKNLIMKNKFLENNNTHAVVLTFQNEEKFELLLVIKSSFALNLIKNENNPIRYKDAIHIMHHELAHIHDNNKKLDANKFLEIRKKAKNEEFFTSLSQVYWSEYIANYISSPSVKKSIYPLKMAKKLISLIKNKKNSLGKFELNRNKDLTKEMIFGISKDINSLIKTASYLLGYLHGLKITLTDLDKKLNKKLETSFFIDTWNALSYELYNIRKDYPSCLKDGNTYKNLDEIIEKLYFKVGINCIKKDKTLKVGNKTIEKV